MAFECITLAENKLKQTTLCGEVLKDVFSLLSLKSFGEGREGAAGRVGTKLTDKDNFSQIRLLIKVMELMEEYLCYCIFKGMFKWD